MNSDFVFYFVESDSRHVVLQVEIQFATFRIIIIHNFQQKELCSDLFYIPQPLS